MEDVRSRFGTVAVMGNAVGVTVSISQPCRLVFDGAVDSPL